VTSNEKKDHRASAGCDPCPSERTAAAEHFLMCMLFFPRSHCNYPTGRRIAQSSGICLNGKGMPPSKTITSLAEFGLVRLAGKGDFTPISCLELAKSE
jgi:hypothetical protein